MKSNRLYVVNASNAISDAAARQMAHACNIQVERDAAPAWGKTRVVVEYHSGRDLATVQQQVPKGSWVIVLLDKADTAGALGWHWQDDQDRIYGEIFAEPCFRAGSTALTGPYAVSSVLSHEVLETFGDPYCNVWSDTGRGYLIAQELCDPVEADGYQIDGVQVSNFVLPEWFDPTVSVGEKFDFMGKLTAPFSMSKGGYWVQMPTGSESQKFDSYVQGLEDWGFDVRMQGTVVFSPEMPEWQRELKLAKSSRNTLKRQLAFPSVLS